jgi:hypothetical protein
MMQGNTERTSRRLIRHLAIRRVDKMGKHRDEEPKQRPTKITEKDTSFTA